MPCTTILVGKKASVNGATIIARNDDGSFTPKKMDVRLPEKQPRKYRSVISHVEVDLPADPLRYTLVPNVDQKKEGLWPACGINAANVAMTATETITANPRVIGADPYVELQKKTARGGKEIPGGIGEEDLVALVLPYIRTAREGVERVGALLEKYGTYEPNGMAFSDSEEIWWLETIGGHHYIARRVPDDQVIIAPNMFNLDSFDLSDAFGKAKDHICSADLREFIRRYGLCDPDARMINPRVVFGTASDHDHIYNTPRAWYMARYFAPHLMKWDGEAADRTPISNDIPWSVVPEKKIAVEDVRYVLGSYYQGTPYDPYDKSAALKGKYRTIAVPNSDVCGILEIRGSMPDAVKGVLWYSMGGSGFTACFPQYAGVDKFPAYFSGTTEKVSTDHMYWHSRLIAALTDAHYNTAELLDYRYTNTVMCRGRELLNACDEKVLAGAGPEVLSETNEKIAAMVREESDQVLKKLIDNAGEHMKIRFHRGDN